MNYVELGKTGLKCAKVSFGGIPIQRSDAANTKAVVDALEKYGMNYMDSARGYTVSEEYLGAALEGRREKFILATKSMSRSYEAMKRDIGISLANFRTDYIDVYQIHNLPVKDLEEVFSPNGAYRALEEAKAEGKIGHIGVTIHMPEALEHIVDRYSDKFETVMFPYSIVETQGEELLRRARSRGMGTICMKPLAGGNLDDWRLALKFVAASDAIDIMIPGMGSVEEVDRNAAAAEEFGPLTEEELAACEAIRAELGSRFCRRCGYCAPCTVGINIPSLFTLVNYLRKYDLSGWARSRYDATAVRADACVECGLCESRCPYQLPIRDMLKAAHRDLLA